VAPGRGRGELCVDNNTDPFHTRKMRQHTQIPGGVGSPRRVWGWWWGGGGVRATARSLARVVGVFDLAHKLERTLAREGGGNGHSVKPA